MEKHVWQFTNQRKLTKKEFIDYFERKVFRTIRKDSMLSKERIIKLKKPDDLNTLVLKKILEKKFSVEFSDEPNLSSENLSQIAEENFKEILKGNFSINKKKIGSPLYFLSDREIELYAKLEGLTGEKRKRDERVQTLFEKFLEKNPDLEINVVNAIGQLNF